MIKTDWKLARRDLLKGLGVGAACLPLLRAGRAQAAGAPKRLVVVRGRRATGRATGSPRRDRSRADVAVLDGPARAAQGGRDRPPDLGNPATAARTPAVATAPTAASTTGWRSPGPHQLQAADREDHRPGGRRRPTQAGQRPHLAAPARAARALAAVRARRRLAAGASGRARGSQSTRSAIPTRSTRRSFGGGARWAARRRRPRAQAADAPAEEPPRLRRAQPRRLQGPPRQPRIAWPIDAHQQSMRDLETQLQAAAGAAAAASAAGPRSP